jgi:hypothetical protein
LSSVSGDCHGFYSPSLEPPIDWHARRRRPSNIIIIIIISSRRTYLRSRYIVIHRATRCGTQKIIRCPTSTRLRHIYKGAEIFHCKPPPFRILVKNSPPLLLILLPLSSPLSPPSNFLSLSYQFLGTFLPWPSRQAFTLSLWAFKTSFYTLSLSPPPEWCSRELPPPRSCQHVLLTVCAERFWAFPSVLYLHIPMSSLPIRGWEPTAT